MKSFLHGLMVCFGLLAGLTLTGCGTTSSNGTFFTDTSNTGTSTASSTESTGVNALLPHRSTPSQSGVAHFRVGQTVVVTFSGAPVPIDPHKENIKEDGTITLPLIGPISAVGKTAGELQSEIYNEYVPKYYVHLNVTVTSGEDLVYYVGGEVTRPGVFQYISDTTVTKAIQAAGGLTPFASHGKIWLVHASNGKRIKVNYDDALRDPADDPPVYPDDQITVSRSIW